MKTSHVIAAGLASFGLLVCSTANAQKIRNYQDTAVQQYGQPSSTPNAGYVPPGAPKAPPNSGQQAQPQGDGQQGEEGDKGPDLTNHAIQMSSGQPQKRETLSLKPEEMYRGVIPGTRDEVKHLSRARKKGETSTNRVLWIGFQPRDQSTRVFIQTAREANYEVSTEGNDVVLTLSDAKLSARNFSRFIDTTYFKRNVQRIESKRLGRDSVEVRITLLKSERPQVNSTTNYVYLEFSADEVKSEKDKEEQSGEEADGDDSPRALDE